MEPTIMYFLLLNCGLVVRGFSLRSCVLDQDEAVCSLRGLTEVPTDIPPFVKSIDLSKNHFNKIEVSNFTHFPNLTSLNLTKNTISLISKRTFSKLSSLQQLTLSRNKIIDLQDDVFDGLFKLLHLRLDSNKIQAVAPNAFRSLSSLTLLELSHNKLRKIARVNLVIQHMPQLRDLMIRNNEITTFRSQDLRNVSAEITSLDVSGNPLVRFEVTADVFPKLINLNIGNPTKKSNLTWAVQNHSLLRHVTTLDVSEVQLASIDQWRKLLTTFNSSLTSLKINPFSRPSSLINLSCSIPTLSKLEMKNSNLLIISDLFQMCNNVTSLNLERNTMRRIENGSFKSLHHLEVLILSHNLFQYVPFAARNLVSLRTLDLAFNLIKTLGCEDFAGLSSLTELKLQRNEITALSHCPFVNLSKLESLILQENRILKIGNAFQSTLPNLKNLFLDHNKLMTINKNAFRGLRSLTKLNLAKNQISVLEHGCFSGLKSLKTLLLCNNEVTIDRLHKGVFDDLVNLTQLRLENNHLNYGHGTRIKDPPFLNLSRLETLIFDKQTAVRQGHLPLNFLQGPKNLLTFSCNNFQLVHLSPVFFTHTPHLTNLDISSNNFMSLSSKLFTPIPRLMHLQISSNNLRSLDFLIHANLTRLKVLNARKNPFSGISEDIIKSVPSLLELNLTQNRFSCDCENSWFVKWIKNNSQTQVADAYSFECNYPSESKGKKLLDLNVQSCLVDISFNCFISSTCVNIVILVASFTFHFSRFQLTYAYYIFLAWLYDSRNRQKRAACHYDAFVSYNGHDEAWVYGELVPRLEQEQGWRLCLHHRDFLPGKPIVENIAEAIYGSRKTICVVSRRYLQSEWCSKEMQLASFRLFDEREDVLILVFLEDIPSSHLSPYYRMKRLLKRRSYLSWPRAAQHPQLFWEKLRQALRSTATEEEDRLRLTVTL